MRCKSDRTNALGISSRVWLNNWDFPNLNRPGKWTSRLQPMVPWKSLDFSDHTHMEIHSCGSEVGLSPSTCGKFPFGLLEFTQTGVALNRTIFWGGGLGKPTGKPQVSRETTGNSAHPNISGPTFFRVPLSTSWVGGLSEASTGGETST